MQLSWLLNEMSQIKGKDDYRICILQDVSKMDTEEDFDVYTIYSIMVENDVQEVTFLTDADNEEDITFLELYNKLKDINNNSDIEYELYGAAPEVEVDSIYTCREDEPIVSYSYSDQDKMLIFGQEGKCQITPAIVTKT